MKRTGLPGWIALGVLAGAGGAVAMDVGLPGTLPGAGKMSLEVFYEDYGRDIRQDCIDRPVPGEPTRMYEEQLRQEENRFMARFGYALRPGLALRGLLGFTRSEDAENDAPVFGLGVDYLAWSWKGLDATVFAAWQSVTQIKYDDEFLLEPIPESPGLNREWPEGTQKEKYDELSAGAMVSMDFQVQPRFAMRPYAGFQLSKLDGDEKYDHTVVVNAPLGREQFNGDIQDDGVLSLFAGAGLFWDHRFGLRLEGRFVNQQSFSAGLLYFF